MKMKWFCCEGWKNGFSGKMQHLIFGGCRDIPLVGCKLRGQEAVKDSKMLRLELRWHSGAKICHRRMACKEGFQYLSCKMCYKNLKKPFSLSECFNILLAYIPTFKELWVSRPQPRLEYILPFLKENILLWVYQIMCSSEAMVACTILTLKGEKDEHENTILPRLLSCHLLKSKIYQPEKDGVKSCDLTLRTHFKYQN